MTLSVKDVVNAQAHIGTLKKEAHPKTNKYWVDVVNGVVVIDPESIASQLEQAKKKIDAAKKDNKDVLIVCEKKMYTDEIQELATQAGFHYLNYKVPAGFLTNFETLTKRIASMNEMEDFMETDDFIKLTKKEQLTAKRKLKKAQRIYKGVKNLTKKPDLVVIVDGSMMESFIHEVKKEGVDNIVFSSTNFGRVRDEESLIISNVGSYKSIDFVLRYLLSGK